MGFPKDDLEESEAADIEGFLEVFLQQVAEEGDKHTPDNSLATYLDAVTDVYDESVCTKLVE